MTNIWNCFSCYTCNSICPSGNNASEVNQILRQMSIENGKESKKLNPSVHTETVSWNLELVQYPTHFFDVMVKDVGPDYMKLETGNRRYTRMIWVLEVTYYLKML